MTTTKNMPTQLRRVAAVETRLDRLESTLEALVDAVERLAAHGTPDVPPQMRVPARDDVEHEWSNTGLLTSSGYRYPGDGKDTHR